MDLKGINTMKLKLLIGLTCCCVFSNVFALDQAVKEETTPPPAETAITPDQLPPILTTQK